MPAPTLTRPLLVVCSACVSVTAVCTWLVIRQLRTNHSAIHEQSATTRAYTEAVTDLASISRNNTRPQPSTPRAQQPEEASV